MPKGRLLTLGLGFPLLPAIFLLVLHLDVLLKDRAVRLSRTDVQDHCTVSWERLLGLCQESVRVQRVSSGAPKSNAQKAMSRWDNATVPSGHPGHHLRCKARGWAVLLVASVAGKFQEADNALQTMLVFTKIDY